MKKQIIVGITAIACVALCAAVLPRSAKVGNLPAEPIQTAVSAEIEVRSGFGWIVNHSVMGGGTTVHGKGDINKQIGIMGGDDSAPHETSTLPEEQPAPTGDAVSF